jgi:hypothetical protein
MKDDDDEASFHVVVVDSGPLLEGKQSIRVHYVIASRSDLFILNVIQAKPS